MEAITLFSFIFYDSASLTLIQIEKKKNQYDSEYEKWLVFSFSIRPQQAFTAT